MRSVLLLVSCSLGIFAAVTNRCPQDIFRGILVLQDGKNVTANTSQELSGASRLEVVKARVPVLCKGAVKDLLKLSSLIFWTNEMEEIVPGAIENVPNLEQMMIVNNNIKVIPKGVFNDLSLRVLQLKYCKIETIERGAFEGMSMLNILILDNNRIAELDPTWFVGCLKLYRFSVEENRIRSIPEGAFKHFADVPVNLNLRQNGISMIHPRAFEGIRRAEYISLEQNWLRTLDDGVFSGIEIEALDLETNKLECISDGFLSNLNAQCVYFSLNPIECGKCADGIIKWGQDKGAVEECLMRERKLECLEHVTTDDGEYRYTLHKMLSY